MDVQRWQYMEVMLLLDRASASNAGGAVDASVEATEDANSLQWSLTVFHSHDADKDGIVADGHGYVAGARALADAMRELGDRGWELVTSHTAGTSSIRTNYVFKRPVRSQDEADEAHG